MAVVAMDRNDQNGASQDTRGLRQERELKQWMIQQQKEYQDSGDEANNSGENWTEVCIWKVIQNLNQLCVQPPAEWYTW